MKFLSRCFVVMIMVGLGHAQDNLPGAESSGSKVAFTVHPKAAELLKKHCYECHGGGASEGNLKLDKLLAAPDPQLHLKQWIAVWQNLRAQTMPPSEEAPLGEKERKGLITWIERDVFRFDAANPDPGRVTIRRLNREEYENTIRDLVGIEFETSNAFPADDTGYGFDTIGDVLTISPLLLEKYIDAAKTIVEKAVPPEGPKIPIAALYPDRFVSADKKVSGKSMSFTKAAKVAAEHYAGHEGPHSIRLDFRVSGSDEATDNTAMFVLHVNGKEVEKRELGWDFNNSVGLSTTASLKKGKNVFELEMIPKVPPDKDQKPLNASVRRMDIQGPIDGSYKTLPSEFTRIFMDGAAQGDAQSKDAYREKVLRTFTDRAYRRPVDNATLDRLIQIAKSAEKATAKPEFAFERGVSQALIAVLASPRFLFRAEVQPEPNNADKIVRIDEYALASRLSYFLWSSMPDVELFKLAQENKLRVNLQTQVDRMIASNKSDRFIENFVGQWLRTRDVEAVRVDARRVLGLKDNEEANKVFPYRLRNAMRRETESLFSHILRNEGSALDLLQADYTFVNEALAKWYGIDGVKGDKMQKVSLDPKTHRGGLFTHSSFLIVTSNPVRTSPVKRGLFVLENILGTPAPPPPANVPPLEDVLKGKKTKLSMREVMELHRKDALCASCHARMDPLGLAMENFNALGGWRDSDNGQPIDSQGQLITGEKFSDARELGRIIATRRKQDYYRCLAEKMITYAVGRGVEYYDAPTIDRIVSLADKENGKLKMFVYGIVTSAPFQMRRGDK